MVFVESLKFSSGLLFANAFCKALSEPPGCDSVGDGVELSVYLDGEAEVEATAGFTDGPVDGLIELLRIIDGAIVVGKTDGTSEGTTIADGKRLGLSDGMSLVLGLTVNIMLGESEGMGMILGALEYTPVGPSEGDIEWSPLWAIVGESTEHSASPSPMLT